MLVSRTISKLKLAIPRFYEIHVTLDQYADMDDAAPGWRKYELLTNLASEVFRYIGPPPYRSVWLGCVAKILNDAFDEVHRDK